LNAPKRFGNNNLKAASPIDGFRGRTVSKCRTWQDRPARAIAQAIVGAPRRHRAATARGRVIALVPMAAIGRARPIAPKAVIAAQRVAVTAPRLPIAAATPRAVAAVAAAP
jgi:hypothetical protein